MPEILNKKEKQKALRIARKSIADELKIKYDPGDITPEGELLKEYGVFVTIEKRSSLRGCIGLVIPTKPLYKGIEEMAKEAAFKDPRFPPLTREEWGVVDIEISVLTPLKKIESIDEIKVGEHGLLVRKGFYSGLLLPQVAERYGWTPEEFLSQTCMKAGLPPDTWKVEPVEVFVFSADVFSERDL